MSPVRVPVGGGGTSVTLDMIRGVAPEQLRGAARSLAHGSTQLDGHHRDLVGKVQNPLLAGVSWTGVGQPQASAKTQHHTSQLTGVSGRLRPAATILNGLANYLHAAKRQVANIDSAAGTLHVSVGSAGDVTVNDVAGETPEEGHHRGEQAGQLQGLARSVLIVTAKVDGKAAAALNALQEGDPTASPPANVLDLGFWKQNFSDLVVPPLAMGAGGAALWGAGKGLSINGAAKQWLGKGRHRGTRAYWGRHVNRRPSAGRTRWLRATSKWGSRAGFVVAGGLGALNQWQRDSGRTDLSGAERVGRAADRGLSVGAGVVAGAEAGAVLGSVVPGLGTVAGGIVGGAIGGVAGSAAGNWVADHTVDAAGHVAQGVKDDAEGAWHKLTPW